MIKRLLSFVLLVSLTFAVFAQIPNGYYDNATGKTGAELKTALHGIIDGHTEFSYDQVWEKLKYTDEDPNNTNNVICLYTGWSIAKSNNGGGVSQWNREHTWAKSHGNFGESAPAGTDLHHLRPTDVTVNSARGNLDFDNGGTIYIDGDGATLCKKDGDSWEPWDEVKGDVARIILYMDVRYDGGNGEPELKVVDNVNTEPNTTTLYGEHGKLSTLLQWHAQDPVSDWERRRNNRVYEFQNNRNPFIDHPEYVNEIWGGGTATLSFTSSPITTATQGQPYSYSVKTTGPNIAAISISPTTIPSWLTLSSATDGNATLSGTPSSSGSFDVVLSAADGTTTKTQSFTIVVAALEGLKFTSTPTTSATVGAAYSYSITTSDAAHTSAPITITATTKPTWLTLTDNGNGTATLSGTPSVGDAGANAVTLSATDGFTTVAQNFNITVTDPNVTKTETFTNIGSASTSYLTRSWTGDDGSTWTATQARTDQVITTANKAICLKDAAGTYVQSGTLAGGCGSVSFKTLQVFTGTGGTLTLFINGTQIGSAFAYSTTEQTATFSNINVTGSFVIKIVNNGSARPVIDDVSWTGYTVTTNALPSITNILNNPSTPLIDQEITVSATITDSDGTIQEAYIMWGTTSGSLTNKVSMALNGGSYEAIIPAQSTAGTIYFTVSAKDNSGDTKTSDQQNFAVNASNALPVISNITINPSSPITGQAIIVSANITDSDGSIQEAWILWGTAAGNLTNNVAMTLTEGKYSATIPAQSSATTIYLSVNAKDNLDATSQELYNFAIAQNQLPTISNFAINPTNPTTGQAITVSVNLTDADGTIQEAWIDWGASANSLTNKLDLSLSAGVYSCSIPAQSSAGTIYLAVTVKDNVLASATSTFNFNVTSATGIDDNKMSTVKVYPNPAKNSINIEINEQKASTITISNIIGETMIKVPYNGGKQPVDISMLKSGVYFVTVSGNDFKNTIRIVKY